MRELTPEECEFIAGGLSKIKRGSDDTAVLMTTEEPAPIVVTATPPPPPPFYPPYEPPYVPPPPPYYPPSGGGGGGTPTPPPPPPPVGCSDGEALEAEGEIEAKSDDQRREYASYVRAGTDNVITHTGLIAGASGTGEITPDQMRQGIIDNNISPSQMLGLTHNHPAEVMTSQSMYNANRYPSVADWQFAKWAVEQYGAPAASFSLYILGPDGVTREYPYSSMNNYYNSSTQKLTLSEYQMNRGTGLPAPTKACGS